MSNSPVLASCSLGMCCESEKRREKQNQNPTIVVILDWYIFEPNTSPCCDCEPSPGPRASACAPVKCWVPEKERSRVWAGGARGCRPSGVGVCAGVCQLCCGPVWSHHRSGKGDLHRGVTRAPDYSVGQRHSSHEHSFSISASVGDCRVEACLSFLSQCRGWPWGHFWWTGTAVYQPAGRREGAPPSPYPAALPVSSSPVCSGSPTGGSLQLPSTGDGRVQTEVWAVVCARINTEPWSTVYLQKKEITKKAKLH